MAENSLDRNDLAIVGLVASTRSLVALHGVVRSATSSPHHPAATRRRRSPIQRDVVRGIDELRRRSGDKPVRLRSSATETGN